MDQYEDYLQENIIFKIRKIHKFFSGDVDPNTFEEFLEPEEYVDHGHLFTTDQIFNSKVELVDWAKETAMKANTYLIINQYLRSRTYDRRPYITLACKHGAAVKKTRSQLLTMKKKKFPSKGRVLTRTKKCGCPFKLKGEHMATSEN
ncbi:hypothetical protein M9H77_18728 [Catharanthus roseus]|uniref:Uncharacterized protein n=1 Tax=Catharanthus roseus TaxID=4058 RepID=A0ACC0B8F8_CATRO|nr:hypothetical protein M9H77_18728 [Catharanthus roseus]